LFKVHYACVELSMKPPCIKNKCKNKEWYCKIWQLMLMYRLIKLIDSHTILHVEGRGQCETPSLLPRYEVMLHNFLRVKMVTAGKITCINMARQYCVKQSQSCSSNYNLNAYLQ
jgi:hypothetical protein